MKFAIDILWLNDEGQVMDLVESVPACKADPCVVYKPKANSVFVLEVPAGYAKAKGIAVGSTVTLDY